MFIFWNKPIENTKSLKIWEDHKEDILRNLQLLNEKNFWSNIVSINRDPVQQIYVDVKSLLRNELVKELYKMLNEKFLMVGSNWKKTYPSALYSNYSIKYI